MKSSRNIIFLKAMSTLVIVMAMLLDSCTKSNETALSAADTQNVNSESASDSYANDATEMANISVGSISSSTYTGRTDVGSVDTLKNLDDRFKCAVFSISRTGTKDAPAGVITIDFTTGCTDTRGVTRKGKIVVTYAGKRFVPGSTITTTFVGYSRNGVAIEGIHTMTNVQTSITDSPKYTVTIVGGKITFTDGKVITREQTFTYLWQRAANPTQDNLSILKGGVASGTNKNGKSYTMSITADLLYSRACAISNKVFIPVSGTKLFTAENRQYTVDYGTGSCDNDITVSVGGASKSITVSGDGN